MGVSIALAVFQLKGLPVMLPFGDNQRYDLVVEYPDGFKRVQVKTTTFKRGDIFECMLRTCGGNKSGNSTKNLDCSEFDLFFVCTSAGDYYIIPAEEMTSKAGLALGKKYEKFKGRLGMSEPISL